MEPSYAPLGPIVSIVPTERRSAPVALAVAAVAVLLLGFLALAATMILRDRGGEPASSEPAAATEASIVADPTSAASAAPVEAAPVTAAVVGDTTSTPTHDAAPAAAPARTSDDRPQARTDDSPRPRRRAVRRTRRARARHASRPARRQQQTVARSSSPARPAASRASDEPRRLTPRPTGSGFGNSNDVMRSLGL